MLQRARTTVALLVLLLSALGGCMFIPIEKPEYEKVAGHVGYAGVGHQGVEFGVGLLKYKQVNMIHGSSIPANQTKQYALALRKEYLDSTSLYAIEASLWGSHFGLANGLSLAYYTDFASGGGFYLRPDIGVIYPIGPVWFRASIGWNIRLVGTAPGELNSPFLSARLSMPLDTTAPATP